MIIDNISRDSPAFNEEIFGPVFSLFRFKDDQEAIELSNSSVYGLSGAVFSKNIQRAKSIA